LESQSVFILREAYRRLKPLALLWSLGKDSNVLLWLARKAFLGRVPFPVLHVDTGKKFPEMYEFRTRYAAEWQLDLRIGTCPPVDAIDPTLPPAACSAARKTAGLAAMIEAHRFAGVIAGIRRDEQATRAKERVFSPRGASHRWDVRNQPPEFWDQFVAPVDAEVHVRVHPLLAWREIDIWRYIKREQIPVVDLYFSRNGQRYRSLGDQDITAPINSDAGTIAEVIRELRTTRTANGRAVPWIMNPRTRSSASALPAISDHHPGVGTMAYLDHSATPVVVVATISRARPTGRWRGRLWGRASSKSMSRRIARPARRAIRRGCMRPLLAGFTGVDAPYAPPPAPDLVIETVTMKLPAAAERLAAHIEGTVSLATSHLRAMSLQMGSPGE
jgi:sulfate adenylyltransferase subunit 2